MSETSTSQTGLWQVSFELPAAPALSIMEALEESALSVSVFELESDDFERTTRWRVEMLIDHQPDDAVLNAELSRLLKPQKLKPANLDLTFLAHEDWLSKAAMPRDVLEVGRFYIHGENDPFVPKPGRIGLQIDAGMAFGSGDHGSTAGCLLAFHRLLRRHQFKNVLDLGCGSAILAIAAAKARRARVTAADNDPLAVDVARRNCAINGVGTRIRCLVSEGYANPALRRAAPFDLVFANILADPLCALAPGLKQHLGWGGYAILAGLLDRQATTVIDAHRRQGLRHVGSIDMAPWQTLILKRVG